MAAFVCLMLLIITIGQSKAPRASANVLSKDPPLHWRSDPITDQFLQRFRPLRQSVARRHALAAEIETAAAENRIDPDLLLALVAVESGFKRTAVSSKGARGLGQVMFPTARAVAPSLVHRPSDLYDARRNLTVTAAYLRNLLIAWDGDLKHALITYHQGSRDGRLPRREDTRYVSVICTYYAALKTRRRLGETELVTARPLDLARK
jgi:soluble lytic murein transglycosylase-like protein